MGIHYDYMGMKRPSTYALHSLPPSAWLNSALFCARVKVPICEDHPSQFMALGDSGKIAVAKQLALGEQSGKVLAKTWFGRNKLGQNQVPNNGSETNIPKTKP